MGWRTQYEHSTNLSSKFAPQCRYSFSIPTMENSQLQKYLINIPLVIPDITKILVQMQHRQQCPSYCLKKYSLDESFGQLF